MHRRLDDVANRLEHSREKQRRPRLECHALSAHKGHADGDDDASGEQDNMMSGVGAGQYSDNDLDEM